MTLPAEAIVVEEQGEEVFATRVAWFAVAVAALGYFVDVFDMWLFANFRVPSLKSLGLSGNQLTDSGAFILNCQQGGFLLGGFAWGIMGDKRGRVSVMFGSILLYSIATLLTSFVTSVPEYALLRAITGFGLAGEIGAGITLVSELLPKEKRGYGTTIVATLGVAGSIGAAYVGRVMEWKHAFILGAVLGFLLLSLRIMVYESGLYSLMAENTEVRRGSLILLVNSWKRFSKFMFCIFAGFPIYLVFALLVTFSPEIAAALSINGEVSVPDAMLYASIGITGGDLLSGLLSQRLKSRKKPMWIFLGVGGAAGVMMCLGIVHTPFEYCLMCGLLGLSTGYWACLVTTISEQFGTNMRATVTTAIPNLVRASAIPLTLMFVQLKTITTPAHAALYLTLLYFGLAYVGLFGLKETFGRDLDYVEK